MRFLAAALGFSLLLQQAPAVPPVPQPSFEEWLSALRAEALSLGIKTETLDQALTGLEPVPTVIQRDRTQAEIVQTLDRYLQQRLSKKAVRTAQSMRTAHAAVLKQVSEKLFNWDFARQNFERAG